MKKTLSFTSCRHLIFALLVAIPAFAPARDTGAGQKPGSQPPLRLALNQQPINRQAPEPASYAPVVGKTSQSVVFVYSTKQVKNQDLAPYLDDPVLRRFFGAPGSRRGMAPGQDQQQRGLGSGVIVSADGYILTNNHVVNGADDVKVSIGESLEKHDARVVGTDALADLAVLKIEATNLRPATFGDSEQLQVGDVVFAIGNPFGLGMSVSRGIVSALGRGNLGIEQIEDFIQTDAAINMGNSGGALIDNEGRVIGINTAILSGTGGFNGIGFAIPSNLVRTAAEQIVSTGSVNRGFLGVAPQVLTPDLAAQFHAEHGALVAEVTPGGAAEKAGVQPGDVLTRINNTEIRDPRQLLLTISQLAPGTEVSLEYSRGGKEHTVKTTLQRRPGQSLAVNGKESGDKTDQGVLNGVAVGDITAEIRNQLDLPVRVSGAVVTQVDPTSPSAQQGLREGDVILELDRQAVKNADDAIKLSEKIQGPKITLRIWREGQSRFMVIDESHA
jgi:serine protease Do